jgi:hypothetical protein
MCLRLKRSSWTEMKFFLLAFIYLFVFFGFIYGFFVHELNIGFGGDSSFNFSLTGWAKNLLCIFGLFLLGAVPAYPIVRAVYRALGNGGN